jgi:hypothetical protein
VRGIIIEVSAADRARLAPVVTTVSGLERQ